MQGVHEIVAFLIARRLAGVDTKVILDVQGDWHEATRLYGSPLRRLLNPGERRARAACGPPCGRGAHRFDADDRSRARARRRACGDVSVVRRRRGVPRAPPAPLPERPRAVFVGVLERYKAFDTLVEAWRRARRAFRTRPCTSSATARCAIAPSARRRVARADGMVAAADRRRGRGGDGRRVARVPAVALRGAAARRARGRLPRPRDRRRQPRRDSRRRPPRGERPARRSRRRRRRSRTRSCGSSPTGELRERLGAAARQTGEEWGVTPAEYAAKVRALVDGVLAG